MWTIFVDARAAEFNKLQQPECRTLQTLQSEASRIHAFQLIPTSVHNLFRDQEAGGSNPLAPTFPFKHFRVPVSQARLVSAFSGGSL
jgi:hypothetical protein